MLKQTNNGGISTKQKLLVCHALGVDLFFMNFQGCFFNDSFVNSQKKHKLWVLIRSELVRPF